MLSTVACVAKKRGEVVAAYFRKDACFGWASYTEGVSKDKMKTEIVIQYLCAPKTSPNQSADPVIFQGQAFPCPGEVNPGSKSKRMLSKEACDFWVDLLKRSGFKFDVLFQEDAGGVPFYMFEVSTADHFNYYGLTLATLTALRYINEVPGCVQAAVDLHKKFPHVPPWDLLMAAVRSDPHDKDLYSIHGRNVSGHSLVYRFSDNYPSCYAECVDAFLMKKVQKSTAWDVQSSFGNDGSLGTYFDARDIKDIKEGKIYV